MNNREMGRSESRGGARESKGDDQESGLTRGRKEGWQKGCESKGD